MLPSILDTPHMFANKFLYTEDQVLAYDCAEQLYFLKVQHEYQHPGVKMDTSFYSQLPFVQNHV